MSLPLARLALRRSLAPAIVVALLGLAALVAATPWRPDPELEALLAPDPGGGGADALARAGTWSALLALAAPLLVARAAWTSGRWHGREADWLLPTPAGAGAILASTWLGHAAAGALVLAGVAAAAELAAGAAGPGWQLARRIPIADVVLLPGDARAAVELGLDAPPGAVLRARVLTLGGPAGEVRLALQRRGAPHAQHTAAARPAGAASLAAEVPPGSAPLVVALERSGGFALVALAGELELLRPIASARRASLALLARVLLALAAWTALALGLAAWMRPAIAALLALALALPALALERASAAADLVPWARLPEALELAGEGIAPAWPGSTAWLGAVAVAALGLVLGDAGLRRGRRGA